MSKREILHPNISQYGIHDYREITISDRLVVIGAGDVADQFLGVHFMNCEIKIQSSGNATGVILSQSQFTNCIIKAAKIQKIPNLNAKFDSCCFAGKYEVGFYGSMSLCDFSGARLNQCLFFDSQGIPTCIWPRDGHLLICNLAEHRDDFMQTVPVHSILWLMAKKGPDTIVLYKDDLKKIDQRIWKSLETKKYVCSQ